MMQLMTSRWRSGIDSQLSDDARGIFLVRRRVDDENLAGRVADRSEDVPRASWKVAAVAWAERAALTVDFCNGCTFQQITDLLDPRVSVGEGAFARFQGSV
jgi:hypothetical protein